MKKFVISTAIAAIVLLGLSSGNVQAAVPTGYDVVKFNMTAYIIGYKDGVEKAIKSTITEKDILLLLEQQYSQPFPAGAQLGGYWDGELFLFCGVQ